MIKFKKGDRVIRINAGFRMRRGTKLTVLKVLKPYGNREFLVFKECHDNSFFLVEDFKLLMTCKVYD